MSVEDSVNEVENPGMEEVDVHENVQHIVNKYSAMVKKLESMRQSR